LEFAASLTGGGGLIFLVDVHGAESLYGGFIIDLSPLQLEGLPKFQNTAEFITGMVAFKTAYRYSLPMRSVGVRGDSMSAISWLANERFKGERVTNAACAFVLAASEYGVERVVPTHLPAASNNRCDALSRNVSWIEVQNKFPELRGAMLLDSQANELIAMCDPRQSYANDEEFTAVDENSLLLGWHIWEVG